MKFKLLIFLLIASSALTIQSQNKQENNKFDIERYKERKSEYIKKELNLTEAEAKAFLPLSNELLEKKFELNKQTRDAARELRSKQNKTEGEYSTLVNQWLDAQMKEAELQKEYYQKFLKVLPAEKVYKYRRSEMKFMREEIDKYKKGQKSHNAE